MKAQEQLENIKHWLAFEVIQTREWLKDDNVLNSGVFNGVYVGTKKAEQLMYRHIIFCKLALMTNFDMTDSEIEEYIKSVN